MPERLCADERPGAVERAHRVVEAATFLADQVLGRHRALVERDLTGRRPAHAQLPLELRDAEPGKRLLHHEAADPAVAGVGIGLGEHEVEVADARVRDPQLLAGQHVGVAVAHRSGTHPRHVAPRVGLRQAVRRLALPRRDPGHVLLLERFRAVVEHRGHPELRDEREERRRRAHPRDLLDRERVGEDAAPLTAVLLRERQAREAGVTPRVPARPRVLLVLVGRGGVGRDLRLREPPQRLPELEVLVGEDERASRR